MKYGAIDIGTNSMRLMIATVENGVLTGKQKWLFPTRMGEGLGKDKVLDPKVMDRNLEALTQAGKICEDHGVEHIIAFGTSALRDATNKEEFLQEAKRRTGVSVEVLSGDKESTLAFLGIIASVPEKDILVLDVGGGSTEWVVVRNGNKVRSASIDVGAVRMKEAYVQNDPPDIKELDAIRKHVEDAFSQAWKGLDLTDLAVVGIGGTATTMSAMNQEMTEYRSEKIQNSKVTLLQMEEMLEKLGSQTLEARKETPGLQPARADVIIPGMLIVLEGMKAAKKMVMIVSDSDNLEGAVYDKIKRDNVSQKY